MERDGFGRTPPDQGGELEDADVERVAGSQQRNPVAGLLGGCVDRAGRGRAQHPLHGCAVEDLDLVGFQFLGERHLEPAPAVGRERAGSPRPADREIARRARPAPWLLDMGHREWLQAHAHRREGSRHVGIIADRSACRADAPVRGQPEIGFGDW